MKTFGSCFLGLILCAIAFGALNFTMFDMAGFKETRSTEIEHVADKTLEVSAVNGSITVTRTEPTNADGANIVEITAHIRATTQERLDAVEIVTERDEDGNLQISSKWPAPGRKGSEGCSFEIQLPDAKAITLHSSNGRLEVTDFASKLDLKTSNGRVIAKNITGDVKARSSNGRITVLARGKIDVDTSNGRIEIGQIGVMRPDGKRSIFPFTAETSNGSVSVTILSGFKGELSMRTNNGSIHANDLGKVEILESSRRSMRLKFDNSDLKSRIKTSNGSITVKVARQSAMMTAPTEQEKTVTKEETSATVN